MANEKNLIPNSERTPERIRENCSKAGKASGAVRGFRATIKRKIKENPEFMEQVFEMLQNMVLDDHDLRALELLIELYGESPKQMEIALKKQELKLKKEKAENAEW